MATVWYVTSCEVFAGRLSRIPCRCRSDIVSATAMRRPGMCLPAVSLAVLLLGLAGCGSSGKSSPPAGLVPIGAGLSGRSGLRATVYAKGPPTVAALAFDPQGRLWLAAAGLEAHTRDGVYLIAKAGEPAVKVISGLNDPLGLLWHAGELYVASLGQGRRLWRIQRQPVHRAHEDPERTGAQGREQRAGPGARRPLHDGNHGVLRPLPSEIPVVGRDRLLPPRRQRSASVRRAHPRARWARLRSGHRAICWPP